VDGEATMVAIKRIDTRRWRWSVVMVSWCFGNLGELWTKMRKGECPFYIEVMIRRVHLEILEYNTNIYFFIELSRRHVGLS
jgi:hypothetical protein